MSGPDPVGRVKACTECRQQKVRCDAYRDYSQPCSRCRAAQLPCIISRDFQRRPKQSKAQLQHELDLLRAQSGAGQVDRRDDGFATNGDGVRVEPSQKKRRRETTSPSRSSRVSQPTSTSRSDEPSPSLREVLQTLPTPNADADAAEIVEDDITDLFLEDMLVEGYKIKDCYKRFLDHYAPHLPFCDSEMPLQKRYQYSSLLFWAMVCIGSRGYANDRGLYMRLGPAVLQLAFKSLMSPPDPIPVLQAVLIICNWPLPVDMVFKEPCQALAGAATSIAIQNGLHMYTREQDFIVKAYDRAAEDGPSRTQDDPMRARNRIRDEAVISRTRVWCHCLIVFQNTYLCDGLPPTSLTPCFRRSEVYGEIVKLLPELQGYRLRLHKLQIEAINVIASSCDIESDKQDTVLNAMITTYDDRIRDVAMPRIDNLHLFIRNCVRVSVLGLIWLVQQEPPHYHALRLYKAAQEVITLAGELNREVHDFTYYMPHFFIRMVLYSGHVVLRIHKSPLGDKLDHNDGERALGIVVPILKKRSAQAVDLLSINAAVLQQLWTSKKAFVHDGKPQNGLRVDVRYRLILNPVSDDVWWWRKEFATSPVLTEEMAKCNERSVGGADAQVTGMDTMASHPAAQGALEKDLGQGLMNFEHIFDDFQNWWSWGGLQQEEEFEAAHTGQHEDSEQVGGVF